MKTVCIVTGTRAEYGLLRSVIEDIQASNELELQLVVTGMHLSPEFGLTIGEIEADRFKIDKKLEILLSSDSPVGVTKSIGLGMIGFADTFSELKPDLLLVLGDRFEILAAVSAAMIARIPVAHLHGGELTMGAVDESIRHSITKMSHLHFVAAEEYRKRVVQLGENPKNVLLVGGLGIDAIARLKLLKREVLEQNLGIEFGSNNILVTFHPATLDTRSGTQQVDELLAALSGQEDSTLIFTMPNADAEGHSISKKIKTFVQKRSNAHAFTSLGQLRYFSCLQFVDVVIGNSSSGLLEVPSFKKATINIGSRQDGRLKAASVIDCEPDRASIEKALAETRRSRFKSLLASVESPYGEAGASQKIVKTLESTCFSDILQKTFYDLPPRKR